MRLRSVAGVGLMLTLGLAALAGAQSPAAGARTGEWLPEAALLVTPGIGQDPTLDISLEFADRGTPGHVTLYVPAGFAIYPVRPAGYPVGQALLTTEEGAFGAAS